MKGISGTFAMSALSGAPTSNNNSITIRMLLSTRRFGSLGRRCFSELAENANVNHPRMSIAKNYLKLKRIADSIDENSLRRALTEPCTVDDVISQKNLSGFEVYLTTSTAKIYHAPFVNNPDVWQNWPQWRVVVKEFSKVPLLCYLVCFGWVFQFTLRCSCYSAGYTIQFLSNNIYICIWTLVSTIWLFISLWWLIRWEKNILH